jgi:hypothetical protein
MHAVQSTKQREQIEPGGFQACAKVEGNFHLCAAEHNPSMAHLRPVGQWRRPPAPASQKMVQGET